MTETATATITRGPQGPSVDKLIADYATKRRKFADCAAFLAQYKIEPSQNVIRRTIKAFDEGGDTKAAAEFREYHEIAFGASFTQSARGRAAPIIGEARLYKAQRLKTKAKDGTVSGDALPFVRLTLGALGIKKSEQVLVRFHEDSIVITRPTADELTQYARTAKADGADNDDGDDDGDQGSDDTGASTDQLPAAA